MRIVHIAAEFAPIAKTGGLGEVLVGLSRELGRQREDVEIILPKYPFIDSSKLQNLKIKIPDFKCLNHSNTLWSAEAEGCALRLLETHHPARYFQRDSIYGFEDDAARFIYFSRAALEYLKINNQPIDILHLHDWHSSLCAPLIKDLFKDLAIKKIVLSLHNVEYQGKCGVADLDAIGLDGASYLQPDKLQDDDSAFPHSINLLKGGIVYSDAIVPVSPSYAKEILTPFYGFHLDKTLGKFKHKITGILNGIDETLWNPSTDPHLPLPYAIESVAKGKEAGRSWLAKKFPLNIHKRPWIGAVTRLVPQKGPELLEAALVKTLQLGGTFVLLGSSPLPKLQEHFNSLKEKYRGNSQVLLHYEYNEALAHLIYAGLDFLAVPSHFEPCGLTQLIAMQYGTVPIVRATGGLKDTVFDCDDYKIPANQRNGFTFGPASPSAIESTLERAFQLYRSEPATFQSLIRRGMESDFSWKKPAQEYLKLYRKLTSEKKTITTRAFSNSSQLE